MLINRVRLPGRQGNTTVWLPFAPVALGLLYTAGYVIHVPALFVVFGDMTTFICFMNIGIWEACIYSGLIKNRVFDRLVPEVAPQLRRIEGIIEGLAGQMDADVGSGCDLRNGHNGYNNENYQNGNFKKGLAEICLLGAYVKRRLNLMLYDKDRFHRPAADLFLCIKESSDYLALSGVVCSVESSASGAADMASVAALYDAFEAVAERAAEMSECMLTNITSSAGELTVKITLDTEKDEAAARGRADDTALCEIMRRRGGSASVVYDEGDVFITLSAPRHSAKNVYGRISRSRLKLRSYRPPLAGEEAARGRNAVPEARHKRFYKRLVDRKRIEAAEAKVIIHDRMGRALMISRKFFNDTLSDGRADNGEILRVWKKCLNMFSEENDDNDEAGSLAAAGSGTQLFDADCAIAQLKEAAEAVGVRIAVNGRMPMESRECMRLIILAARECLTNAIRHADADVLYISIGAAPGHDEIGSEGMLRVVFSDNGSATQPEGQREEQVVKAPRECREGGGLSGLRWHVERKGGHMRTEWSEGFKVILTLPADL